MTRRATIDGCALVALEACGVPRPPHLMEGAEIVQAAPSARVFPPRVSDYLGICLKIGDGHVVVADGKKLYYPSNAICVRPPGCVWSCSTTAGFVSIDIASELVPDQRLPDTMAFLPCTFLPPLPATIARLLRAGTKLYAEEIIVELVTSALDAATANGDGAAHRPVPDNRMPPTRSHLAAVESAREFLSENIASAPDLEAIAAAASVDKYTLLRYFKRSLNTTPRRYLTMLRVDRARTLLARGEAPGDVAHITGFADQPHMTRWFRGVVGTTPAAYARQMKSVHGKVSIAFKT